MSENKKITLIVQRGNEETGIRMEKYEVEVAPGSTVLDAVHALEEQAAPDLAVRWNCKAMHCGSCSAEVNGHPKLMCGTKVSEFPEGKPIVIKPLKSFPVVKDLVTDVSKNYEINTQIPEFQSPELDSPPIMFQEDVDRIQEFRKCIECYLCQDVCHIVRSHGKLGEFAGPRFMIRLANLEMHPLDERDRIKEIKDFGPGYCNITRCCTEVCPQSIKITDNAIIPLKERVADHYYDPIKWILRKIFRW